MAKILIVEDDKEINRRLRCACLAKRLGIEM